MSDGLFEIATFRPGAEANSGKKSGRERLLEKARQRAEKRKLEAQGM